MLLLTKSWEKLFFFFYLKLDEQLSPICKCQQNVGSLESKANEALAHFTESLDVKGTEEDGRDHENRNQGSSGSYKDRDVDNVSDSEKEGKKEKNYPPQMFSPQRDEILATVIFGESKGSSTGKITLWGKSDSAESVSLAPGKITAEVNHDSFNVKVEIKNVSLSDSGTSLATGKRKNSKNKCCHERQYRKSQCPKYSKYQCPSADHSAEHNGKYKGSSKHKIQTAINKNASLKMNIEAKEIKVEYTSRKKNLKVNIKPGEQTHSKICNRYHEDMYWSEIDYFVTEASCNTDWKSSFSFHEKVDYAFPEGCTLLPPPKEFADCDKIHLDTIAEGASLNSVNDRKESDSLATALRICGEENYFCKYNEKDYKDHTNVKEDFSEDQVLFSKINYTNCLVASNTLNNPDTEKECNSKNNILGQERNNCDKCRDTGQKPARRKSFPDTTFDIPSPVHPRRDSGFYSLPSLKVWPKETKAGDVFNRNSHVHTSCTELCKCPDSAHSPRSLRGLNSSYQNAFMSFDHNITIYPSEPEESLDDACLLSDYADYVGQGEETEEMLMKSLRASGTINEKKENRHEEPLRNIAVWEEDSESTEDALEEGMQEYNNLEKHTELQNKAQLVQVYSHSRSPFGELINDKESTNYASTESNPNQLSALQQDVHPHPAEPVVTKKRRGSVMTVITGELERKLIQGDIKLIPDSFSSAVRKEPKLLCSTQEKSLLSSLLLVPKDHEINNESESFPEIRDISRNTFIESDCHTESTQAAVLSTSSAHTEKKENFTEHSSVKGRPENLNSKQLIDSLRREPGAHQQPPIAKSNSDEIEKNIEIKEDIHHNADIPPSSVKQISQKGRYYKTFGVYVTYTLFA